MNRKIIIIVLLIICGGAILFSSSNKMEDDEKNIIKVEGFEIEYVISDRKLKTEDFINLTCGSSIDEITDILGEPDTWIGSGMMRPVYLIEGNKAVVLHFKYSAIWKELNKIVVYNESGQGETIKEQ